MKNKVLCIAIALLGFASVCAVHLESVEQDSPENIVSRFFELDSKGTRLTPEGWYAVASLFVRPEAPPKRLLVEVSIGSVYVGHPEIKGEQAVVGAEFMLLGQIDS